MCFAEFKGFAQLCLCCCVRIRNFVFPALVTAFSPRAFLGFDVFKLRRVLVRKVPSVKTDATPLNNFGPSRMLVYHAKLLHCYLQGDLVQCACVAPRMLGEMCKRIQHCCSTLWRSRNKRNVGVVASKVNQTVRNNFLTTRNNSIQQCWKLLENKVTAVCVGHFSDLTCMQSYCLRDAQRFT